MPVVPLERSSLPYHPSLMGHRVKALHVDGGQLALSLVSGRTGLAAQLRVNASFAVSGIDASDEGVADPVRPAGDLVYRDVIEAKVERDGTFRLSLEGDVDLIARPDPELTSWELRGHDFLLLCLPGDEGVVGWHTTPRD